MKPDVALHVAAGALAIGSGFVSLYSRKGAALHRRSGAVFVAAMIAMCASGALIAIFRDAAPRLNVPASALAGYLVVTAFATVRSEGGPGRGFTWGTLSVGIVLAGVCLASAAASAVRAGGLFTLPAFPFALFGAIAAMGAIGDARLLREGGVRGPARIRRHLWRMTFALWIATASFFLGQSDEIPAPFRVPALLAAPVVAVLGTLFYWLVRYRPRPVRLAQSPAGASANE